MTAIRRPNRKRQAGFSLMEMIVVVAIIGILALISGPAFLRMMNRYKLTGTAREVTSLMHAARLEAIKQASPAQVNYDVGTNRFIAWVDLNQDGLLNSPPDKILAGFVPIPAKVEFRGPGDGGVNGANSIDGWDDAPARMGPIFRADGSVDRVGAFRLRDTGNNFLEVRVETPGTGRMVLKKYFEDDDEFFLNGEEGHKWEWR